MPDAAGQLLTQSPPDLPPARISALAKDAFGLSGTLTRLTSERDLNHLLRTSGGVGYVLKVAHPAEPAAQTEFQIAALDHIARAAPALPVPRMIRARDGAALIALPEGGSFRVLTYLEGTPLHAVPRSPAQRRGLGAALAALARALQGFHHPAADHMLLWDIRQTPHLAPLLPSIPDPGLRDLATRFVARFQAQITPALAGLPWQVVHADLNPHNVLVAPADPTRVAGVLDFGDMVRTPRICDVAVAAAYQIDPADPLGSLAEFIAGYHAVNPLLPAECDLLFDLITARQVTTLAITAWRAARYPDNAAYILRNASAARDGLLAFAGLDPAAARLAFYTACERATP